MAIKNKNTFMELVTSYHETPEKYVFFVGAGLSQPLFPSWGDLLKRFLEEAKEGDMKHDGAELLRCIENGDSYLDIAEVCVNTMGKTRYRDIMEKVFDKEFSTDDIPDSYKALIDLSPKTIITTNYDRIPDIGGKGKYRISTSKNAPEASRSFSNNKNIVFKMHGDITDQSSIVLTTSDYQNIINKNESARLFLNSVLSTKILIFVGFSLSDPHMDTILDKIKSINDGIPLSHFVLLNESSSFRISSFENRYGVKVISYTPSDRSHPEVIELLRALNHESIDIPEEVKITEPVKVENSETLIKYLNKSIKEVIIGTGISIFYSNGDIYLSFNPTGETKGEIQKEILSIIKIINFDCNIVNNININVISQTQPLVNFNESQAILMKVVVKFDDARKYAAKEITTTTLWKMLEFYLPAELSNIYEREQRVDFPMNSGIVGE